MSTTPRRILAAVCLLAATAALSGCSAFTSAANNLGIGSYSEKPVVGQCWQVDNADASYWVAWESRGPVPCTVGHEAYTFAVAKIPGALSNNPVDSDGDVKSSIDDAASNQCELAARRFSPNFTDDYVLANLTYYIPSESTWRSGARWVRCDINLIKVGSSYKNPSFAELPAKISTLKTALTNHPEGFAFCVNNSGSPTAGPLAGKPTYADCTKNPDWTDEPGFTIPGSAGAPYSSSAELQVLTAQECTDKYGGSSRSTYAYLPTEKTWTKDHDRLLDCWASSAPLT